MSPSVRLSTVYASDEDVAVYASSDYMMLAPTWQKVAQGTDGAFAPGASWVMTSTSTDFEAAGSRAGLVVHLRGPSSIFKGGGELFAVAGASGHSLTLRRIGMAEGVGASPAPASGLSGVEFLISTLGPQIEEASFDLNRRFAIDPTTPGRTPADLHDIRQLRRACVLGVLARRYTAESRTADGDFARKLHHTEAELADAFASLELRWGSASDRLSSSFFSTRIVR